MRKQLLYSIICLLCLGVAIIITSALMEVNTCLKGGFLLEDAKFLIAALLQLPVYYHTISEIFITVYCILLNKTEEKI